MVKYLDNKKTKKVMHERRYCYLCGREHSDYNYLEKHHVFFGSSYNKKISEKYGLLVYLCPVTCHKFGKESVHHNREIDLKVKKEAQAFFEKTHSREEFMKLLNRNFME